MTCKQTLHTIERWEDQPTPSEVRMEQVRENVASFTEEEVQPHPPASMRDYKDLKMSFKTRVKIWLERVLVLPNF
jgi:hypothetical protein